MSDQITLNDFEKIRLIAGTIEQVEDFPKARNPSYKLTINFGPDFGILKSSAQITKHYSKESLIGRQILAVVNLPEKNIAGFQSQCLVTGFADKQGDTVLLGVDMPVPNGSRLI